MPESKIVLIFNTRSEFKNILKNFTIKYGKPNNIEKDSFFYNKPFIFCEKVKFIYSVGISIGSKNKINFNEINRIKLEAEKLIGNIENVYLKLLEGFELQTINYFLSEKNELIEILSKIPEEKLIMKSSFQQRLDKVNNNLRKVFTNES